MKKNFGYLFVMMLSLVTTPCFAVLGESFAGLEAVKDDSHSLYQIASYQEASVVNIREYIAKDGTVFAVSWKGRFKPDLKLLLGKYYPTLIAAIMKKPHGGRSPVHLKRRDIVIESSGHPGAFSGRAYLPGLMPGEIKEWEIK